METIQQWADITGVSSQFILAMIALVIIVIAYEINPKIGLVLGILAIMAILANAKKGK